MMESRDAYASSRLTSHFHHPTKPLVSCCSQWKLLPPEGAQPYVRRQGHEIMRFHQNLKHLADARQMIRGKVYDVGVSRHLAHAIDLLHHL